MKAKKMSNILQQNSFKVIKITKKEFELDTGDVYPLPFEFDEELTVEEFQKILDSSKDLIVQILKKIENE